MKRLVWLCVFYCFESKAVNFPSTQGPVSFGSGNISSFKNDPFAAFNHQGCLALSQNDILSLSVKSSYFIPELNTMCLAASKRINKTQTLGLGCSFFGNQYYNESVLKLSLGKKFKNKTGGGISIDYYRLQLPLETYKVKNIITFEIGFYTELNKNFDIAFQIINPARVQLAKYLEEKLPFNVNSSIFYKINNKLIIGAEWCQTMNGKGFPKFGIKYNASKNLEIYGGIIQKTANASLGVNCIMRKTIISIAFSFHPYLNASSSAGFSYFKPNEKNKN